MKIYYDSETDSLSINFSSKKSIESEEVAPGFVLDFDNASTVVGIEIDHASTLIDLNHIELESLPLKE